MWLLWLPLCCIFTSTFFVLPANKRFPYTEVLLKIITYDSVLLHAIFVAVNLNHDRRQTIECLCSSVIGISTDLHTVAGWDEMGLWRFGSYHSPKHFINHGMSVLVHLPEANNWCTDWKDPQAPVYRATGHSVCPCSTYLAARAARVHIKLSLSE